VALSVYAIGHNVNAWPPSLSFGPAPRNSEYLALPTSRAWLRAWLRMRGVVIPPSDAIHDIRFGLFSRWMLVALAA